MGFVFVETFLVSLKLAVLTTGILLVIGVPIGYYLSGATNKSGVVLQAIVSLPLVLPPSVLGFYLLIAFSPENWFGKLLLNLFDIRLAFSFVGILVGSIIFNLPFMINSIQSGFSSLPKSLAEASYTLGKSKFDTLLYVLLPNIRSSIITGICLTFAHTLGEFGVVLMIGGNISGSTRVASIAIYDEVQALNFATAHKYAGFLFVISFLILLLVYSINGKKNKGAVL